MSPPLAHAPKKALRLLRRQPFYIYVGTIFVLLILVILLTIGWFTRLETRKMVEQSAGQLFDHVGNEVAQQVRLQDAPIELTVRLAASLPSLTWATSFEQRMAQLAVLTRALDAEPQMAGIYYAYGNGDFFLVRPLRDAAARSYFKTPAEAAFLVESIEQGGRRSRWVGLDKNLKVLSVWSPPDYRFDPRRRPWYQAAMASDKLVRTAPYVFARTGNPGRTVALRAEPEGVVVGADLRTDTLSVALSHDLVTPASELAIFDETGGVLAFHDPARAFRPGPDGQSVMPRLAELSPLMARLSKERDTLQKSRIIEIDGREWSVRVIPLATDASQDFLALATPVDELMAEVYATQRFLLLLILLAIVFSLPIVWLVSKRIASQLNSLSEQAAAIRRFDFSNDPAPKTVIREIFGLGRAIQQMKETIRKFLEVSTALAAERNFANLLGRVLHEVRSAAGSDGGVIYLFAEEAHTLCPAAQRWSDGSSDRADTHCELPFADVSHPVVAAANQGEPSRIFIGTLRPAGLDYLNLRYGSRDVEMIALPLLGRTGNMVGVLCNFMAPGQASPSPERMALVQAFAGAAAVAIDQQRLLQSQKDLLHAFISLVAGAIDAKSPYTGRHCQRVPELTEMLARAAHESTAPAFADFQLDEDAWEALHIAAWLHDCGKVTTPEYVVDKATKLETIYNRIHEIRMRFEVLKRDSEIAMLRAVAAGGDAPSLNEKLRLEQQVLDEEFAFLAACNEGSEFMAAEQVERLKAIAGRTWQRTLDDRIGISWEERQRLLRTPPDSLPATERLLADKPAHIIERGPDEQMPENNPWGFRLAVPACLYNRGELYNLSISHGTLSDEERYKINSHIVQTIIMLSQLPFPPHLKGVVEMAGGHHEKMDGSGYPKRLRSEELSLPARIMAIADIFEALTATDRPYKPGKKLSESIRIMGAMVRDRHIDPELFKLFLKSGVYRAYAERFLPAELIDEVDIAPYLAS
ncbi:MAG: HD domain-containing phosphohydrolase [Azonexus sp.]